MLCFRRKNSGPFRAAATAVKNVVLFGYRVYNKLLASSIFRLGTSTSETVQHLAAQQETNSFPLR